MKKYAQAIVTVCLAAMLSSCASIVSKSHWPVAIASNPSGLRFEIKDRYGKEVSQGTTPQTVTLASSAGFFKYQTYTVTCFKNNKPAGHTIIEAHMNGWYMGNIAIGGALGFLIIDPATGAMFALPESATVETVGVASSSPVRELHIAMLDSVSTSQRSRLVRL